MNTRSDLSFRRELPSDFRASEEMVRDAFWDVYRPGCDEHYLLHTLRQSPAYRPELSYLAEKDSTIIGGIYYSNAFIRKNSEQDIPVLSFGPLAVSPACQKQGVGAALIEYTVAKARESGDSAIIIYGNPVYYSRFGFLPGENFGIRDGGGDYCSALQVLPLRDGICETLAGCFHEAPVYQVKLEDASAYDLNFPPRKKHALPSQIFLSMGIIQKTSESDFEEIYEIVNDAASAYKGIIPEDRWHEPYMSREELREQINDGVVFYGYYVNAFPVAVMGIQDKGDVCLVRHAYVRTACRNLGIGGKLLGHLRSIAAKTMLVGTWADAAWAIDFYKKHGFKSVADQWEKNNLLRKYWNIPERQVETSVVLSD